MGERVRIDGNISDLFFNTDLGDVGDYDMHGQFTGFNEARLAEAADYFLGCLQRLGVPTPTREALIADFYARV